MASVWDWAAPGGLSMSSIFRPNWGRGPVSRSSSGSDLGYTDLAYTITEISQVAETRRAATSLAHRVGLNETECGQLAIIVTEAATNLVKHTRGGCLILRALLDASHEGIELLVVDRGPGMRDPERCLRDGFSTAGSPGTGLGAIRRMSSFFELFTTPNDGCALLSRSWHAAGQPSAEPWRVGAVCIPKPGETVCGDAWAVEQTPDHLAFIMADGLGHGPFAASAAREALRVFRTVVHLDPTTIVQRIHEALRSTRGAALAVGKMALASREIRFVGLGNISAAIVLKDGQTQSMISHNGTAGVEARKIHEGVYQVAADSLIVLHSDGITNHC